MATPDWLPRAVDSVTPNFVELLGQRLSQDKLIFQCDDARNFTGLEFWSLSGRMGNVLRTFGAKPGDRIAVHCDKSVEVLALFWACLRIGCIYLPLNPAYTIGETAYFVGDAEPCLLVCRPQEYAEYNVKFSASGLKVVSLDDAGGGSLVDAVFAVSDSVTEAASTWDDVAAILYTSGTTGRSKGAMLTHGNLASNALALVDAWQFTSSDVLIHALPVFHTHGLFTAKNTVLLSGGSMLFRRKFDVEDVLNLMPQATAMMGVPTFYSRLLQHPGLTRSCAEHMRLFVSGSAPLLAETHHAFEKRTGHAILERYGMTETSMNASNPYQGARRAGTVGLPLPHIDIRITDLESKRVLLPAETGMIELKGPNLFKGYWRNPEKTAEDMTADGYFRTGDVGSFDEQGYLSITGRAKDLIITGGFNVYPKEIEDLINVIPGVVESAVIGLPHDDFGEAVTAVIVKNRDIEEAMILEALRPALAKFKLPKRILIQDSLPRNAMGKVQKAELRRVLKSLYRPV